MRRMNVDQIGDILARAKFGQTISFEIDGGKKPIEGIIRDKTFNPGGALTEVILTDGAKIGFCSPLSEWQNNGSPVVSAKISK